MNNQILNDLVEYNNSNASWKLVDEALRKMAVLSGHEKDQNAYQKRKETYQD